MPQNTPMKRQFTTIDGRTVMSNLPQHWGGNDWKITGVDNPLPVGNYVQTESGVWIPQKGSDDGAAHVQLTGRNVEIIKEHLNSTALIGAGGVRYFADSIGLGAQTNPVDVRKYNDVIIKIRNGHDEQIGIRIFSYKELDKGTGAGVNRLFPVLFEELPAGSEKMFTSIEYPELSMPHIGLAVQITPVSSGATGDIDVIYIGGV